MQPLWYRFVRWFIRTFYFGTQGGYISVGRENLPLTGSVLVAPVHMSYLDPPAVACGTKRQLRFMAKEELFHGIIGLIIRSIGTFPVRRGESDTEAIREALATLERGEALLVFPEGTRGDGVSLLPINRGVTMLAKRTNTLVVPVGIIGTHALMPRKGTRKRSRHAVTVAYGPGFRYTDVATGASERENRELFAKELERRLLQLCRDNGLPLRSASSIEGSPTSPAPETES